MNGRVQLVICMDTEGPAVDPARADILRDWASVDRAMDKLFSSSFREAVRDPHGSGPKFGWFFLTWSGFTTNPMGRDLGYHKVRDHYRERWGDALARYGDEECWHYHQPSASGAANEWGFDWTASREYDQVISRQILERQWFPACYRAGGTIMDPVSSRWVDAWFPFDYSNRAPLAFENTFDWSGGVDDWDVYHPDVENFRLRGVGRRFMARCMDLDTRAYRLDDQEIRKAFESARQGKNALVSVFEHDYRDIEEKLLSLTHRFRDVARAYPDIDWRYAAPVSAVNFHRGVAVGSQLEIEATWHEGALHVVTSAPVHQSLPWIAVKSRDGQFAHAVEGITRLDDRHWRWTPSPTLDWVEAGVACSTTTGRSAVYKCTPASGVAATVQARHVQAHPTRPHSIWEHSKPFLALSARRAAGEVGETDSVRQGRALLERALERGMSVLDVGCAAGHAGRTLPKSGFEYFGIDPCERVIDIGRLHLQGVGVEPSRLRALSLEELPRGESYDAVLCLNTLLYLPGLELALEIMARAARRTLIVRSCFGEKTEVRFLPDVLLERGFQAMRAYFNVYARSDVQRFLEAEGFRVAWVADERQAEKFGGKPEVVGGVELPYEFLVAERVRPAPSDEDIQGPELATAARVWRESGKGGANP